MYCSTLRRWTKKNSHVHFLQIREYSVPSDESDDEELIEILEKESNDIIIRS